MITGILPVRGMDKFGEGKYHAARGKRIHNGTDYSCHPGTLIRAVSTGIVTKIGYPYSDDMSFKYVEITDTIKYKVRYFYILPHVVKNDHVYEGDIIGETQSLQKRYPGITDHCHLEIKNAEGKFIDPDEYD